jgi:hypothetical protein
MFPEEIGPWEIIPWPVCGGYEAGMILFYKKIQYQYHQLVCSKVDTHPILVMSHAWELAALLFWKFPKLLEPKAINKIEYLPINQAHKALAEIFGNALLLEHYPTHIMIWFQHRVCAPAISLNQASQSRPGHLIFVRHKETNSHGIVFSKPE